MFIGVLWLCRVCLAKKLNIPYFGVFEVGRIVEGAEIGWELGGLCMVFGVILQE